MRLFHAGFEPGYPPVRVLLGAGVRHLISAEMRLLGLSQALVITTPEQSELGEMVRAELGPLSCGLFNRAAMHTPVEITKAAVKVTGDADCLVAIGGGSTIGLSKAIALHTDLPQIVLPTTYAGSEATPILGQTSNGHKETLRSPGIRPGTILYDPELLATLPLKLTVTSGLNAMAHALEALYARDANPLSDQLAISGIRTFVSSLPRIVKTPDDLASREETQCGSWFCGTVLAQVGMSLHHKLCHTLGGSFDLPHSETHAILLPYSIAYNADAAAVALAPAIELFGGDIGMGLYKFAMSLGAPSALRDIGLAARDLDRAADIAVKRPYWNPRPIEREAIRGLLQRAWEGVGPG